MQPIEDMGLQGQRERVLAVGPLPVMQFLQDAARCLRVQRFWWWHAPVGPIHHTGALTRRGEGISSVRIFAASRWALVLREGFEERSDIGRMCRGPTSRLYGASQEIAPRGRVAADEEKTCRHQHVRTIGMLALDELAGADAVALGPVPEGIVE